MEGSKIKTKEFQSSWGHLPYDLLRHIFVLLPAEDLLRSVSFICRYWRSVTGVVLFWKDNETLDFTPLNIFFKQHSDHGLELDQHLSQALESVMNWETIQHRRRCIKNIIFAPFMHLKHTHLALIAQRSRKLKTLMLPDSYDINVKELTGIIQNWRKLEELSIGPLDHCYTDRLFRKLGTYCKNLTKLHLFGSFSTKRRFLLDESNAWIIAGNLVQLRVFNIDDANLCKSGVWILLSECTNLMELNLKLCSGIVDPPISFFILIPTLKYLEDPISVEIKRVKTNHCRKLWSVDSSSSSFHHHDDGRITTFSTDELVNQLWSGYVIEYDLPVPF
ncbi:SKP1/ASK-Interacting protein 18, F-BOX WITH WD-40 2 [Hibiscus trionum]|uniref:SKP1/ASK-Interacting protein 18, F-BOX WITH WD-40 2 n=1 Tax=Hibiscus trionum TaxID=183268 RepID=A0A9W7MVY3_HIBTR|nr:SKP1/ASK-Interacting protein 18, F-BOX WITH WD-40 2 [Hibiscus trionum]